MTTASIQVRPARTDELPAIHELLTAAFGTVEAPRIIQIVDEALADPSAQPLVSLVAVHDGRMVGHVLFTHAEVGTGAESVAASLLAPLAVHPDVQGQDIGGRLIAAGLTGLEGAGVGLAFVLGHPGYYPRAGFEPAGALGFIAPYPIPAEHADAWMVHVLKPELQGPSVAGPVRCAPAFAHPELWSE